MVFNSSRFLLFLAITLVVLGLMPSNNNRKRFLALASCFFYAAWDWRCLGLLLAVSIKDYYSALRLAASNSKQQKKAWLIFSVASNLGILAYFKYCNFFIQSLYALVPGLTSAPNWDILLPAGISFYTFKTMSYTIDVYRGELTLCRSWVDYATFITFFPELIAGPIVRGSVFLPQLSRQIGPTGQRLREGAMMFGMGLIKKMLVADRMAKVADSVFRQPDIFTTGTIWCGVIAYTLQIYCDFSGYSDMAIGVARMIGYDLPENFRMPYLSRSVTEFWRRWHITLSSWLRDYLYIPLGGNRGGQMLSYRNLIVTMLLGGLWHGASWNFIIWGGLHGLGLAVNKLWSNYVRLRLPAAVSWALTILFVMACWVPFRCPTLTSTLTVWKAMFGISSGNYQWISEWVPRALLLCGLGHVIGWMIERSEGRWQKFTEKLVETFGFAVDSATLAGPYVVYRRVTFLGSYLITLMLLLLTFFSPLGDNPFIYFQF